jgi:hypothetical protein
MRFTKEELNDFEELRCDMEAILGLMETFSIEDLQLLVTDCEEVILEKSQ